MVHKKTPCAGKETSEVSEGRQEPFEKITNTTFLLNKDFLVI